VSTLNPFMPPADALTIREWYLCVDDTDPVGPVSVDQIARGIRAGKVPGHAQITRYGGADWQNVLDSRAVVEALKAL
jgi:hypothetical protein